MHRTNNLITEKAQNLRNQLQVLEDDIQTYLMRIENPEVDPIGVQLLELLSSTVRPIYRYIDQLEDGSFIHGLGQKRRNRNPVVFNSQDDFIKFIESQIKLNLDYFNNLKEIFEQHKSLKEEKNDNNKNNDDSWFDWSYDAKNDDAINDEISKININNDTTIVDSNTKKTIKSNPYEKFNGSRKFGHVSSLFESQETQNAQSNPETQNVQSNPEKKKKKDKKKIKKPLGGAGFNFMRKKKDEDPDPNDQKSKLIRRKSN